MDKRLKYRAEIQKQILGDNIVYNNKIRCKKYLINLVMYDNYKNIMKVNNGHPYKQRIKYNTNKAINSKRIYLYNIPNCYKIGKQLNVIPQKIINKYIIYIINLVL